MRIGTKTKYDAKATDSLGKIDSNGNAGNAPGLAFSGVTTPPPNTIPGPNKYDIAQTFTVGRYPIPNKVIKNPSINPGAIRVVTARTCAQFRISEMDVNKDPAANRSPKVITAGLIPSTISFGSASVKIVRDGAKVMIQMIDTENATRNA